MNEELEQSGAEELEKEQLETGVEHRELSDNEAVEKAREVFEQTISQTGLLVKELQRIEVEEQLSNTDKEKLSSLRNQLESAFSKFYTKAKQALPGLPLMFALSADAQKPPEVTVSDLMPQQSSSKTLDRSELPYTAQFADWYYDGEFLKVYNEFVNHKNNRKDGQMTPEEIAFKERIARNIHPYGYQPGIWLGGVLEDYLENKEPNRKENLEKKGDVSERHKVRIDLFRKYLGLPQDYGTVMESPYKPTRAKNPDAVYASFDAKSIVKSIKEGDPEKYNRGNKKSYFDDRLLEPATQQIQSFDDLEKYVVEHGNIPSFEFTDQLGKYVSEVGYDEERGERYISYYDEWDLDHPDLKEMGIELDEFNYPFEIYGRIYESDFKSA